MKYLQTLIFLSLLSSNSLLGQKKVVMEKFTNSYCGSCPNASIEIKNMVDTYGDIIWINHHKPVSFEDNPLNNETSDAFWFDLNVVGVPSGMVDRKPVNNNLLLWSNAWEDEIVKQLEGPAYADIQIKDVEYNPNTRDLNFDVSVLFDQDPGEGNYRLSAVMVEDSVWGQKQHSYYNDVVGHPLFGLGDIIWAYPHRNVVRTILEDRWGSEGIIPNQPEINQVYEHNYSYTVPENYKTERMQIVVLIHKHDDDSFLQREIINANKLVFRDLNLDYTNNENLAETLIADISPNPTSDVINISLTEQVQKLQLIDANGKVVKQLRSESKQIQWPVSHLPKGLYFIHVESKNGVSSNYRVIIN